MVQVNYKHLPSIFHQAYRHPRYSTGLLVERIHVTMIKLTVRAKTQAGTEDNAQGQSGLPAAIAVPPAVHGSGRTASVRW